MSESRKVTHQRIGASVGIIAPVLSFTCILIAIASYPTFSWTRNALSDLGVVPGITSVIFNFGLIASGLLAFIFALFGLFVYLRKNWAGKMGSVLYAAISIALVGIGIFNERFASVHYAFSVAFFVLAPISLFVITEALWLAHQRFLSVFTVLAAIVAALPWILLLVFEYVPNVAIPEFVSGLALSAWSVGIGIKMLQH